MKTWMLLLLLLGFSAARADDLKSCILRTHNQEHRLDKEDSTRRCFDQYKNSMNKDTCYQSAERVHMSSTRLTEDLKSICFYETSDFANLKDCLKDTRRFRSSMEHDEGVFYCYQRFQDRLSKQQCLQTAHEMIFPAKREYLSAHCIEVD